MSINKELPVKKILFDNEEVPISGGAPSLQEKTVTPTKSVQEVTPDASYDGLGKVNVNPIPDEYIVPTLATKEITENGTYNASADGADGYSSVTVNVASSGGGSGGSVSYDGEYLCRVIDYDGKPLKEEWLNTGDVFTMPDVPTHDRLVFQEWSSPVAIVDNQMVIEDHGVTVGAVYTTKSGMTEFDIELTKANGLSLTLKMNGTKDWGDGTSDTSNYHTYADYGKYTIKCDGNGLFPDTSSKLGIFGQKDSSYNSSVLAVYFSNKVTILPNYTFWYCYGLSHVSMPKSITNIGSYCYQYCRNLDVAIIPSSVTGFGSDIFYSCSSIHEIVYPSGVTYMTGLSFADTSIKRFIMPDTVKGTITNVFVSCYALEECVISKNVTGLSGTFSNARGLKKLKIPNVTTVEGAFTYTNSCVEYDFSSNTSVPTANASSFTQISKIAKFIVPDELYDAWKTASNWSSVADYIYKVSEVR